MIHERFIRGGQFLVYTVCHLAHAEYITLNISQYSSIERKVMCDEEMEITSDSDPCYLAPFATLHVFNKCFERCVHTPSLSLAFPLPVKDTDNLRVSALTERGLSICDEEDLFQGRRGRGGHSGVGDSR
jgi:hypothetical protein